MTSNFELYKKYISLRFPNIEDFDKDRDKYFVIEIIRRGKDHPNLPSANVHFKNYYINTLSDVDKYEDEIKTLCDVFKMRAYFSVNYKSYSQVLKNVVVECANRVATGDFKKPYSIYESCSGKYLVTKDKVWVVDIDKEDAEEYNTAISSLALDYTRIIEDYCRPNLSPIITIPTRSGKHLICKPFDVQAFNNMLETLHMKPHSDKNHQIIKKNHLSLLYENI